MSLLLDALRKADRERRSGQPPSPFEAPVTEPEAPQQVARQIRIPSPTLLAGLWAVVIAVLVLALVIWQRPPAAGSPPLQTTVPDPSTAPRVQVNAAPAPIPMPSRTPAPQAVPPSLDRVDSEPVESEPVFSLDELAMPPLLPISTPRPAATAAMADRETASTSARIDSSPPSAVPQAEDALPADVLRRSDLPPAQREQIPSYRLDVHVFNADPARRFVLIDGQRHIEGNTLPGGHRLIEIVPQGMVIEVETQKVLIQRPG